MIISCFKLISAIVTIIIVSNNGKSHAIDWDCETLLAHINGKQFSIISLCKLIVISFETGLKLTNLLNFSVVFQL